MPSTGDYCAVVGCTNSGRKRSEWLNSFCQEHDGLQHRDCPCLVPYGFHRFPKKEEDRLKWVSCINRKNFTPGKRAVVCSIHFLDKMPTTVNPNPALELGYSTTVKPGRRKIERHVLPILTKKKKTTYVTAEDLLATDSVTSTDSLNSTSAHEDTVLCEQSSFCEIPKMKNCEVQATPVMKDCASQWDLQDIIVNVDHLYCSTELENTSSNQNVQFQNTGIQCNLTSFTSTIMTENDYKFYTGISMVMFLKLVEVLRKCAEVRFRLSIVNQILLVLVRLRLGLLFGDLGRRFDVSTSVASKIFKFWLPIMAKEMRNLIVWLPRSTIRSTLPQCFKDNYSNVTCVIDCTEVFVERAASHWVRAVTYSNYKSHNTFKFLIAIAPNGLIMFVSDSTGGRASDRYITQNSGFLNYLLPGDHVLADRGFLIDDILPPAVSLSIPVFTKGLSQLPEHEVIRSRRNSNVRVHVERVINKLKTYRILKFCMSLSQCSKIDDIVVICAALCNLQSPAIKT